MEGADILNLWPRELSIWYSTPSMMVNQSDSITSLRAFFSSAGSSFFSSFSRYRRIWLISACAYSGKRNDSMRLIKDMRLYGT